MFKNVYEFLLYIPYAIISEFIVGSIVILKTITVASYQRNQTITVGKN